MHFVVAGVGKTPQSLKPSPDDCLAGPDIQGNSYAPLLPAKESELCVNYVPLYHNGVGTGLIGIPNQGPIPANHGIWKPAKSRTPGLSHQRSKTSSGGKLPKRALRVHAKLPPIGTVPDAQPKAFRNP